MSCKSKSSKNMGGGVAYIYELYVMQDSATLTLKEKDNMLNKY